MSDTIVVVDNPARRVVVSAPGPQGAAGPAGPAGGEHYVYDRHGIPAATWPIVHNLGRLGHVTVLDDDGEVVVADVVLTTTTATVTFGQPFSGMAIIG